MSIVDCYNEDRIINNCPGPFLTNCSPYVCQRFSDKFITLLENYTSTYTKVSKVIVLGDVAVGKTCLVNRFCRKMFDSNYKATIGVDFEVENFKILNIPFSLQIWDTAGQERFKSIAQSYYRGAHAVIIVFDLTNPESLYNCQTWFKEASQTFPSKFPFLFIVGTKKDLIKNYAYKNMEICAIKMATKLNGEYWSISSKIGTNVDSLFRRIAALTFIESIEMEFASKQTNKIGNNLIDLQIKKTNSEKCSANKCFN
ncbi:ras-related protein Rab-34-like [Diorhabda carinulata]|uniref:ras-related protein Rab-34-like n=1 Tax=Diorhabda carinulata TaxID=1163345 RepID=UPI0025A1D8BB|nr:ras-related protein Rab-34-like [Diorhabda carinulata]